MSAPSLPRFTPGISPPANPAGPLRWFAFRRRELLVTSAYQLPEAADLAQLGLAPVRHQYLGRLDDTHCYSAELPADARPPDGMAFRDLRALYGRLPEALHAVAGRAVQIVEWDRSHQFCGACGTRTELSTDDRSRFCPACKLAQFPRLAPAMIVAVERENELLLGRSPHFPPGIYSVLAGFVEPGESLEEAVRREVFEETSVEVEDVRYFGNQPWPFPNSLMLAFTARYRSGEIQVDGRELEDAGWYPADDFPMTFPGRISISQWLMEDFLRRHRG
ncbi:MAG: NAD(+) diphosphatase [Proteobacteria bacterium]|nr:NAD(+) diphosphatase [Pseudomonadota bacterium]